MTKHLWCLCPLALLTACATPTLQTAQGDSAAIAREAEMQRKYVIQKMVDQENQVSRVMYKLTTGASDLCGARVGGTLGMKMVTGAGIAADYRAIARSEFGLDDGLTIVGVAPDSPAAEAGLAAGDHVVSMGGMPMTPNAKSQAAMHVLLNQAAAKREPVTVSIRRDGAVLDKQIVPVRACDFPSSVEKNSAINAYADGDQIVVQTGMLEFVHSDEELATVLSHELSHNILGHIAKGRQNAMIGGALGLAADILVAATTGINPGLTRAGAARGAAAYSVQFEQEADYEGLYVMQHAGYAIDNAPNLWRRMAAELPESITIRTSHPTSPERFVALNSTISEIKSKQEQHLAMLPNLAPGKDAATKIAQTPAMATGASSAAQGAASK